MPPTPTITNTMAALVAEVRSDNDFQNINEVAASSSGENLTIEQPTDEQSRFFYDNNNNGLSNFVLIVNGNRVVTSELEKFQNNDSEKQLSSTQLLYGAILSIGVVMNVYVVYRMWHFKRRNYDQFRNGIGVCLFIMAMADLLALVSLLVHFFLPKFIHLLPAGVHNLICKLTLFSMHTAYTQTMWCWLFMSGLRYIATTRPLQYTTLWRIPYTAMSFVLVGSLVENMWLIMSVTSNSSEGKCQQEYNVYNRVHRTLDVLISFCIPTALVFYMDIFVICRRRNPKISEPMLQIVINRPSVEPRRLFHRFAVITLSSMIFNAPENVFRLLTAFGFLFTWGTSSMVVEILVELSHGMFFAQFAFNAFYLTTFVYDKSVLSKTNSSRQLSLSFRQRLEENSHMIRERASTVSYKSTSPIPPLARNSSCCALEKHWL